MSDSLTLNVLLFGLGTIAIAWIGTQFTRVADRLADATGLGEALMGAVFLGGSTSLSGIVTSMTAAGDGYAELAISNALGGIAAQTAFLCVADLAYKRANLEHAAASLPTLVQGTLLISLLAIPLLAMSTPIFVLWHIHPASLVLFAGYWFGLRLSSNVRTTPMWRPQQTQETVEEDAEIVNLTRRKLKKLWVKFALYALAIAGIGYILAKTGGAIASQTQLSETVVGGLFTAISTSLPELVTAVAAVRRNALTLAMSGIIGGNSFDVLLIALSDLAYRQGSIYHALQPRQIFVIALTILMTAILLLGLLRREKYGLVNIGFEGVLVLLLYFGGFSLLFWLP